MKLARCEHGGRVWWGTVENGDIHFRANDGLDPYRGLADFRGRRTLDVVPLDSVTIRNPVPTPSKIICVGLNYRDHAAESGMAIPAEPLLFAKFPSSLIGPDETIVLPPQSEQIDWEVELAIVVGRTARNVAAVDALEVVAGYTVANDVSARDLQMSDGQFVRAKSFDTFCPVGPFVVTVDELGAGDGLRIGLEVNGRTMQDSTTSQLHFDVPAIVAYCSAVATLHPGDLILTGTPHGTGFGLDPPRYLQPGDVVSAWIEGIGTLTNPVAAHDAVAP